MKLDLYLPRYTEINSKWFKDFNIKPETIKLLEENIGKNLPVIGLGNDFWIRHQKSKGNKSKNNWDYLKVKTFCTAKETINKTKDILPNGRKYLQIIYLIRGLIFKMYKDLIHNSIAKIKTILLKNGQRN